MCDADRYRDKAAELRIRARSAVTPDLAAMYLELAQHWEGLAERSGKFAATAVLPPERAKRQA
jgi:hypothetical protein